MVQAAHGQEVKPFINWGFRCKFARFMLHQSLRRIIMVLLLSCGTWRVYAQEKSMMIEGHINVDQGEAKGAYLQISESGGGGFRQYTADDGSYSFKMRFQREYTITYSKKGYLPYRIVFSTEVPKERLEEGISAYYLDVMLVKSEQGFTTDLIEQAAERISYTEDTYGFDSDQEYKNSMETNRANILSLLEEFRKNGKISAALAAKAKQDAEEQAAKAEALKKEEDARLEKMRREAREAEALRAKQVEDSIAAEQLAMKQERMRLKAEAEARAAANEEKEKEAFEKEQAEQEKIKAEEKARREAEEKALREKKEKEKQEALAKKQAEEEKSKLEKQKFGEEKNARLQAEEKAKAAREEKEREEKEKLAQEMAAKKLAEEKAKAEKEEKERAEKERLAQEMAAKKLAEEKAKAELEERARKEKEEKAALAIAERVKAEQEAALKKQKEMEALQAKLKNAATAAEAKRLEDLAKQEELFRDRQSKFAPVMGVYSNTSTIINGKKAYGYINFGNGVGNQDLTREEYEEYTGRFKKEFGEKK